MRFGGGGRGMNSLREKAVMAVIVVALLYAAAVAYWFLAAESSWKKAAKRYRAECRRYDSEAALIADRRHWNEAYESEKASMPMFSQGKATDSVWLRKVGDIARTNLVYISSVKPGEEISAGDVLELPIEIDSWEGSLEALVKFMYGLENSTEGMFNIRSIEMRPSSKKGYLRGSMSLTCAYMRGEQTEE